MVIIHPFQDGRIAGHAQRHSPECLCGAPCSMLLHAIRVCPLFDIQRHTWLERLGIQRVPQFGFLFRAKQSICCQCPCPLCGSTLSNRQSLVCGLADAITLVLISETFSVMRKTHISSSFRRPMHQALFSYVHIDRKRLFKDRTSSQ